MAPSVTCIVLLSFVFPLLSFAGRDNVILNHPSLKTDVRTVNIRYWLVAWLK